MSDETKAALFVAEQLVAQAVAILLPHCGEQVAMAAIQQMAEEQALFQSEVSALVHAVPLTNSLH